MILGVTIFYDDGLLLETCLKSLKKVTDRILAIDGAYKEFPHKDFLSDKATLEIAERYADEVIIPKAEWLDEPAKRNAYLVLKKQTDYYLMLDGDEEIIGEKPKKLIHPTYRIALETVMEKCTVPGFYNRLFRHHKGMHYYLRHNNLVTKDGVCLTSSDDHIPVYPDLKIIHRPGKRPRDRQLQDGKFESVKAENRAIIPKQISPMSGKEATPIQLKYIGAGMYRGYDMVDSVTVPLVCKQGDPVYVSREKAAQLQRDYAGQWVVIKEL